MATTAAKNEPRFRSKHKGVCWCCNNGLLVGSGVSGLPLYPVGTDVGVKLCCATCCKDTFDVRPGFTRDGIKMSDRFATPDGIDEVKRENDAELQRRRAK